MREVFEVEVVTLGDDQAAAPNTWPDEVNARQVDHEKRLIEMETQFAWLEPREDRAMKSTGDIVRERYQRHIQGSVKVTRAVALFALQVACADIEEVWRDEYDCIRQKCSVLLDERNELQRQLEQLQKMYVSEIALADALEAECIHLRTTSSEYSARTGASMAQCEPAASSTSSIAEPMLAEKGESIGEREDGEEPVPSAPTSKRKRRQGRSTPKPGKGEEVGDRTGLFPIDWPAALAGVLTMEELDRVGGKWGNLDERTQKNLVFRIAETIYAHRGTISQSLYAKHRPGWATDVASWSKTTDLRWRDVLNHLQVVPSSHPTSSKTVRSAMI